jgi:trehalose 6-phosphate phosphatase
MLAQHTQGVARNHQLLVGANNPAAVARPFARDQLLPFGIRVIVVPWRALASSGAGLYVGGRWIGKHIEGGHVQYERIEAWREALKQSHVVGADAHSRVVSTLDAVKFGRVDDLPRRDHTQYDFALSKASPGVGAGIAELLAPLRAEPGASAVLCDIDGTLAPIVSDPEDARVPEETRSVLGELAQRYGLVACVTGRPALEARWMVGIEEIAYSGNHGFELLPPGAEDPELDPAVADGARRARDFVLDLDAEDVSAAQLRLENKGPIQALHWREAVDQEVAREAAERIARQAEAAGLVPHWGRKVLELRPVADIDKGTAVERLLGEGSVERALFGGDDRGDLDAFAALREMANAGRLRAAACVGVASHEAPPELTELADVVVDGPDGFLEVLRALAAGEGD